MPYKDPEKRRAYQREYARTVFRIRHGRAPEYAREIKRQYGLTKEGYEQLVQSAGGKCEICGVSTDDLHIDHCHRSQFVRGLLCHHCNAGLGYFKDDTRRLAQAIRYLRGSRKATPTSLFDVPVEYIAKPIFAFVKSYRKRPASFSKSCAVCGVSFTARNPAVKYCSPECRGAKPSRRKPRVHDLECMECGREFKATRSDALYCGQSCRVFACRKRRKRSTE